MGIFRRKEPLSRFRRVLRAVVWGVFLGVVVLRWNTPHEPISAFRTPQGGFAGGPNVNGQWRRYRRQVEFERLTRPLPKDLYRIEIEISPKDVQTLSGYHWNGWEMRGGGAPVQRPEVRVTVKEGGHTYTNVALHLKGSAGSFQSLDGKPAMTLNFAKFAKGQKFHGYSKISLNNSVQDSTYLSEAICREMFVEAGVPVPRVEHATVVLNGRDLNLYVLAEGWGKPFLKRFFDDVDGNLYDGGFVRDIDGELNVNSGENPDDRADLDRLAEAALAPSGAERWRRLNEVLDVDRFLTLMALEVMTCHWDGYSMNRNNYRVFHDRKAGKMVFLPHGLDQTFGVGRSSPQATIQPGMEGMVARAVLSAGEGRKRYLERIGSLRTNLFQEARWTNRLWTLAARLGPTLAAYSPDLAKAHRAEVADFAARIVERAGSITDQLASPQESLTFDAEGVARLKGWKPSVSGGTREAARFERDEVEGGRRLRIVTAATGGVGSWRSRVSLEAGRYRFEGSLRTRGVEGNGGVCLRMSGARLPVRAFDGDGWNQVGFEFEVGEMIAEVELVCELRAAGGEAWFDESSLRLVRIP